MKSQLCPCTKGEYAACCGRYHAGTSAPDAESLMRSRYSAYVLKLEPYLLTTWHESTRPATLELAADQTKWIGLTVKHHTSEQCHATVEFIAKYKINGRAYRMHEISRFIREEEQWYYLDGEII